MAKQGIYSKDLIDICEQVLLVSKITVTVTPVTAVSILQVITVHGLTQLVSEAVSNISG